MFAEISTQLDGMSTGEPCAVVDDHDKVVRQLVTVEAARHAPAGLGLGCVTRERAPGECGVDAGRVRVEVEQPAAPTHRTHEVLVIGQLQGGLDVRVGRAQRDNGSPVLKGHGAVVRAVAPLHEAGDGGGDEMREQPVDVKRTAYGEPQRHRGLLVQRPLQREYWRRVAGGRSLTTCSKSPSWSVLRSATPANSCGSAPLGGVGDPHVGCQLRRRCRSGRAAEIIC